MLFIRYCDWNLIYSLIEANHSDYDVWTVGGICKKRWISQEQGLMKGGFFKCNVRNKHDFFKAILWLNEVYLWKHLVCNLHQRQSWVYAKSRVLASPLVSGFWDNITIKISKSSKEETDKQTKMCTTWITGKLGKTEKGWGQPRQQAKIKKMHCPTKRYFEVQSWGFTEVTILTSLSPHNDGKCFHLKNAAHRFPCTKTQSEICTFDFFFPPAAPKHKVPRARS